MIPPTRTPPPPRLEPVAAGRDVGAAAVAQGIRRSGPGGVVQGLPLALVLALAGVMVVREGGFAPTVWYPVALAVLGICIAILLGGGRVIGRPPRGVLLAVVTLALFICWSFATTAWATDADAAFEGSNRDLLYALVFGLLALWPARSRSVWPVVLGAVAVFSIEGVVTVEQAVHSAQISNFLIGTRLSEPLGYPNATAALYMLGAWLMLGFASRPWLPAPARGLAFGLAGLDLSLNLLTESRGSVFTLPLVAIVYLVLVPGRIRSLLALALVGLGFGPVVEPLLRAFRATGQAELAARMNHAIVLAVAWALVLAVAGWLFAALDDRLEFSRRELRATGAMLLAAAVGGLGFALERFRPWDRLGAAWHSFRYGSEPSGAASHFGGLGSNRYDFWRVGLLEFLRHPLRGIGTDNFLVPYLQLGHSREQPIYPHSLLVDLLSQTGVVGTSLFVGFVAASLYVTLRIPPGRARESARILLVGVSVLFFHGLVDWLWEMPVLGVVGMALLGGACALAPRGAPASGGGSRLRRAALVATGLVAALIAAASFALPWFAARDTQLAEAAWRYTPSTSFALLRSAARFDPLDDEPDVIAGAMASRLHRYATMRSEFALALARNPQDWYANLELGIADSLTGHHALAAAALARALSLDPRDTVVRGVVHTFQVGRPIDPAAVDAAFAEGG